MSDEQLTPEEAQALEAMENDTAPEDVKDGTPEEKVEAKEPEKEEEKPVFKSSRAEPEKPPEGFVPHQAMHAERLKRQELERKLAEIEAAQQKEQEPPPQYVDPLEDPDGFRRFQEWSGQQILAQAQEQVQELQKRQQQEQQVYLDVQRSEAEFEAQTPDYSDAVVFLRNHRSAELQGMGYGPQEIQGQISKDIRAIYDAAKSIGMNPAALAYQRAQSIGYRKADVKPDTSEAEKVTALAKAQDAASGLNGSGAPQKGVLTIAQLAEMSEAELAKVPEDQFKKVMGG